MNAVKPILFNTTMVRAILKDRKTQTRRLVKRLPLAEPWFTVEDGKPMMCDENGDWYPAERFSVVQPGDILWVRETWAKDVGRYMYRANYSDTEKFYMNGQEIRMTWHPSIHMPKEAARIYLQVTSVRMQRLQEITSGEAVSEGIKSNLSSPSEAADALIAFEELWNSTVKPADQHRYGWSANPWVWVIGFVRINKPACLWVDQDTAQFADQDVLMPAT